MTAHIDPSAIPGDQLDPDASESAAGSMRTVGQAVSDQGGTVVSTWQGLAAHYEAPEAATLFSVMDPVKTNAETFGTNVGTVASALTSFAEEIRPIKAELASLRAQAYEFVNTTVANGVDKTTYAGRAGAVETHVDWDEDQDAIDRNNGLISAVNHQMTLLWAAERSCANKIYDIIGFPHIEAASQDNPNGYGVNEIPDGADMPWGKKAERKESCGEKAIEGVGHFVWDGVIVGGLWGTVKGLGTLVLGYNPNTGEWFSGDAYKAAWSNLGMLGVGLLTTGVAGPALTTMPGPVGDFFRKGQQTLIEAGKSMIAWDKWKDDPAAAAGESVFNIGTLIIPGAGGVSAVKTGTGVAAKSIRVAARVADVVDPATWLVRGGVTGFTMAAPVLADLSKALKFGDDFADLGKIDTSIDVPTIEVPKVDVPKIEIPTVPARGIDVTTPTGALDVPVPRQIDAPATEIPAGRVNEPALVGGSHADTGATITTGHGGGTSVDVSTGGGGRHSGVDLPGGGGGLDGTHPTGGTPGSHDTGTPGSGGISGDGGGTPNDPTVGGGQGSSNPWDPSQGDPTLSDASHGPGWTRETTVRGNDLDPNYGQPMAQHGTLDPQYRPPTGDQIPPAVRDLVTDPSAPYGRGPDGHPYSLAEYEARYVKPDGTPNYPGNDGAVVGRRIDFTNVDEFRANYGDLLDRMGGDRGSFMSFPDTPFEYRALPGSSLNAPYSTLELSGQLPPGARIEVSEIDPAFGQPGGGLQVRVLDVHGDPMSITELRAAGFFADPSATTTFAPHAVPGAADGATAIDNAATIDRQTIDHGTVDHDTIGRALIDHDTIDHATVGGHHPIDHGVVDHGVLDPATIDDAGRTDLPGSGTDVAQTQHVTMTGDGRTPELLLSNLQPDTRYIVDSTYIYETDSLGRVVYAEGHLDRTVDLADRVRNPGEQTAAGGVDRLSGDHGGHFFATLFGGPAEGINLTGQSARVNLSDFRTLENRWANAIRQGETVQVEIRAIYPGDRLRPSQYEVTYRIGDGRPVKTTIDNPEP
jgi:hypothetical protein